MELQEPDRRLVGEAGTCPQCGGRAVVERFDLVLETQHERCEGCGVHWTTPFAELVVNA